MIRLLILFPLCYFFTNVPLPFIGSPEKLLAGALLVGSLCSLPFVPGDRGIDRALVGLFTLFVVVNLVSTINSTVPLQDNWTALQSLLLKGILVFLICRIIQSPNDLLACLKSLVSLHAVIVVFAMGLILYFQDFFVLRDVMLGPFGEEIYAWSDHEWLKFLGYTLFKNPNTVSRVIIYIFPITYVLFLNSKRLIARSAYGSLLILSLLTVVGSVSRSGILVLGAILILAAYKFRSKSVLIFLICGAVLVGWLYSSETLMTTRFEKLTAIEDETRYPLLLAALASARERPLLGAGPGSNAFQSFIHSGLLDHAGNYIPGHNLYLNVLVENGIVGLVAFAALLAGILLAIWPLGNAADEEVRQWGQAFQVFMLAFVLVSLFAPTFNENIFWFVVGLALSLKKLSGGKEPQPSRAESRPGLASAGRALEPGLPTGSVRDTR
ncbi:MAG: O-antigen ligase family protein [Deltaproteobacteria bacterium]|nr:O-antigen ligase family protein [Deltaproteobacteria bacterium]